MNLEQLHQKLIAAARSDAPTDRVPYAFEQRILARLTPPPNVELAALWARALWRAAVPCVALTILLAALSFSMTSSDSSAWSGADDLSQQFEQALLASTEQLEGIP